MHATPESKVPNQAMRYPTPLWFAAYMLVLGMSFTSVVRASPGAPDPSFGSGGLVATFFPGTTSTEVAHAVALQADGKLVAAGSAGSGCGIARYLSDGTADPSFGYQGKAYDCRLRETWAVSLQPDGKIVIVGASLVTGSPSGVDFAVVRFNADGSPDTGFGSAGLVITDIPGGDTFDVAYGVAIQPDGKIVVSGTADAGANDCACVVRYLPDGTLDTFFGSGTGIVVFDASSGGAGHCETRVALQPDGRIVLGGYLGGGWIGAFAARLNSDGSLDTGFNGTGKRGWMEPGSTDERMHALALLPDGRILLAGANDGNGTRTFIVWRVSPDGATIAGARFSYGTEVAEAYGMAVQSDGKIELAGSTAADAGATTPTHFELMRVTTDWLADATFDAPQSRTVTGAFPAPVSGTPTGLALQPDGKVVVVGGSEANGGECVIVRYDTRGNLDRSFGSGGITATNFSSLADKWMRVTLQPDGRILVCGAKQLTPTKHVTVVARFDSSGQLDTAFGSNDLTHDRHG